MAQRSKTNIYNNNNKTRRNCEGESVLDGWCGRYVLQHQEKQPQEFKKTDHLFTTVHRKPHKWCQKPQITYVKSQKPVHLRLDTSVKQRHVYIRVLQFCSVKLYKIINLCNINFILKISFRTLVNVKHE